jgi:hypothetical protein
MLQHLQILGSLEVVGENNRPECGVAIEHSVKEGGREKASKGESYALYLHSNCT